MALRYEFWLLLVLALLSIPQDSQSKKRPNQDFLTSVCLGASPFQRVFKRLLPGRVVMRPDFVRDCPNVSTQARFNSNPNIRYSDESIVIDADILVTRLIPPVTQVIWVIRNCEDRASARCELFQTWWFGKEVCKLWGMPNQIWSPLVNSIRPRLRCPLQPGLYLVRNATMDMGMVQRLPFPLERYYWRARSEFYHPTLCGCIEVEAEFL